MKEFTGSRIVITGASGFIGSHLTRLLAPVSCQVVRVMRTPSAWQHKGPAIVEDVLGDVTNRALWRGVAGDADFLFHLAAQTSARVAENDPVEDIRQNVTPLELLLEARGARTSPVIFASTASIVGIVDRQPVDETFADEPPNAYERHKKRAEDVLRSAPNTVSLRLSNVYGPGEPARHGDRGILNAMIVRAIRGEALTVYGSGTQRRDYVFVDDVAKAFLLAALNSRALSGQYAIVASEVGTRIVDAIRLVGNCAAAATGTRPELTFVDVPADTLAVEARSFVGNTQRLRTATGWDSVVSLKDGIDRTIASILRRTTG